MSTTALHVQLEEEEGFIPHAYQDSEGFWTIGIGTLIDARRGGGITHDEAVYLLQNRIMGASLALDAHLPWWRTLDPLRQRVLINMTFNMGIGRKPGAHGADDKGEGLLSFRNTLADMQAGRHTAAAAGMRQSKWHTQVGNRAERLARMWETGKEQKKWW